MSDLNSLPRLYKTIYKGICTPILQRATTYIRDVGDVNRNSEGDHIRQRTHWGCMPPNVWIELSFLLLLEIRKDHSS